MKYTIDIPEIVQNMVSLPGAVEYMKSLDLQYSLVLSMKPIMTMRAIK